jgi:hypothetical protein
VRYAGRRVRNPVRADPGQTPMTSLGSGLPQVTRAVGTLLGSTTVLTAILFYFGWSRAYYFYDYLGVDSSLLELSTRDYLQLSIDGLFVPLTVSACAGLAVLWAFSRRRTRTPGRLRSAGAGLPVRIAGLVLAANGVSRIFVVTPLNRYLTVAPLSLGAGVCLLVYGIRSQRLRIRGGDSTDRTAAGDSTDRIAAGDSTDRIAAGDWAVVFVLVGLSLFWAANDYSADVGRSRARQFVTQLPTLPSAVLYSAHSLSLSGPDIREVHCRDADAAYRFRYDGLKLVLQSGDEYLFLPARWSRTEGAAILLPRSDTLRLEFTPPTATSGPPPTC